MFSGVQGLVKICAISSIVMAAASNDQSSWTPAVAVLDSSDALEEVLLSKIAAAAPTALPLDQRLEELQDALRPTYQLMPANINGNLDYPAVRYVLHRFFLWRHGWYVKAIGPMGDAWNKSSPDEVLADAQLPSQAKGLFEKRLGWHGLSLHETAVLAAMLEDLIRGEAVDGLRKAYEIMGLPSDETANVSSLLVDKAINAYLAFHIIGHNITLATRSRLNDVLKSMTEVYPSWLKLVLFARQLREKRAAGAPRLNFSSAASALVRIGDAHPDFHDSDHCLNLKHHLLTLEDPGTGRVPLSRFYGDMASKDMWQFSESPEYLKELGALDNESVPGQPSVVIPNYITGLSNCVASSTYHWLCCRSECEVLLRHIEKETGQAEVAPEHIVDAMKFASSHSVPAGKVLQPALVSRLHDIAASHGGLVPLHGRLFAQFMHHAYPHECPFPHVSGTTNPLLPLEYEMENPGSALVSDTRALELIKSNHSARRNSLPWVDVEELVVHRPSVMTHAELAEDTEVWAAVTSMAFLSSLAAFAVVLLRASRSLSQAVSVVKGAQSPKLDPFDV